MLFLGTTLVVGCGKTRGGVVKKIEKTQISRKMFLIFYRQQIFCRFAKGGVVLKGGRSGGRGIGFNDFDSL